ncbi:serine/threonine protein kinase [Akkermansiaceae bacterium]|nr:serine/threonine protein kinase [Akkermansiaceae bacterium]
MSHVTSPTLEIKDLSRLLPAFEIEHLIAEGASCAVFKARQPALDRDVAVKILPRELAADASKRSAFQAEAKAMACLSHLSLIRVYDSDEVDGMPYMIMEYVPGKSLFRSSKGKAIDPGQAVCITIEICRGIAHSHAKGIIHGDIHPANILLNAECEPKIGSFGTGAADAKADVRAIVNMLRGLLTGESESQTSAIPDLRLAAICDDAEMRCEDATILADQLERWLSSGSSRLLTAASPKPYARPRPASPIAKPAGMPKRTASPVWDLVKSCAVIAFLLCTIHILWGVYQTKQATVARMQKEEDAKPKVIRIMRVAQDENTRNPLIAGNME